MKKRKLLRERYPELYQYGKEILTSKGMSIEKNCMQHGRISCYKHSLRVVVFSLWLNEKLRMHADRRALVRGGLLHDYFLYDWHHKSPKNRLHGFSHAATALKNARRDFRLNAMERDIIEKHMFPLNLHPPKYKESWIICLSDKMCATAETTQPYVKKVLSLGKKFLLYSMTTI